MSDIQYGIDTAVFPLPHFDTWVQISVALGHFWTSFSEDIMKLLRAVYAKGGWSAVNSAVKAIAVLSPWHMSFMSIGGIMPPTSTEHVHTTSTGRLSISVDSEGVAHISVYRMVGESRVNVASYAKKTGSAPCATYLLAASDWRAMGGTGSPVCQRHIDAVTEAVRWL